MSENKYLNISMLQIYYFLEVASCNSFTNAAQHLYTTQSTLSKNISSLEKALDVQLFIRNSNRLFLTEAGQYLYQNWQNMLNDLEKEVAECRVLQGGHVNSFTIGVLDSYDWEKVSFPIVHRFVRKYPNINISTVACEAQEIRKGLISGNLDLAFTVLYDLEQLDSEEFSSVIINRCPHSVCMLPENPLCEKELLEVSDLKNSNFVDISPLHTPSHSGMVRDLCQKYGFAPRFVRFTTNALSLPSNLINKEDIFICDRYFRGYQNPSFQSLQYRPLINTASGVAIIWKKNNQKDMLKDFVEIIE